MLRLALVLLPLLLILWVVFRLTGGVGRPAGSRGSFNGERIASEVVGIVLEPGDAQGLLALHRRRSPALRQVLAEVMGRLGVEDDLVLRELEHMGFPPDALPGHIRRNGVGALSMLAFWGRENLQDALERALLVGVQLARVDDDYARVGDEYLDPEAVSRQAEETEMTLFGEDRRERYALYGKVGLVLQDMLQGESRGARRDAIVSLLQAFDGALETLRGEMARSMARTPEPDSLQWGESRNRRLYYFKMGVINTLRRAGHLESLRHLYRLRGVNYDVEEAYFAAARECSALVLADGMGIDRLVEMGPAQVHGMVRGALPRGEA